MELKQVWNNEDGEAICCSNDKRDFARQIEDCNLKFPKIRDSLAYVSGNPDFDLYNEHITTKKGAVIREKERETTQDKTEIKRKN